MLGFIGLFTHQNLVLGRSLNLFFKFLGILFGKFKILHSLHFLINIIGSYQRRALDSFLDFFFFLRINLRFKTDLNFLSILFNFLLHLPYFVILLDLFLLLDFFLLLKNLVEHRAIILVHFLWWCIELGYIGLFIPRTLEFGLLKLFHMLVEFLFIDGFVKLPDFCKFFLFFVQEKVLIGNVFLIYFFCEGFFLWFLF